MNRATAARCCGLVAIAYGTEADDDTVDAWAMLLDDVDDAAALEATRRLCRRPSPFPPRPGEVLAEVARLDASAPPAPDAALGHYLAGSWDVHPAVAAAARRVHWDRAQEPDKATWQFRQLYAAVLDEGDRRSTARSSLDARQVGEVLAEGEPRPLREIIAGSDR